MVAITDPDLERYCVEHTTPPGPLFERLAEATQEQTEMPQMQVGPLEGAFLHLLAALTRAQRVIEIGTFTGYSALAMAEALPPDGQLFTLDRDAETGAIARRFWSESPHGEKIVQVLGDAHATVKAQEGPFDLAFIDADKPGYRTYWDDLVPKMRAGGLLVVDNVLWSGSVLDPETEDARAIAAFNDHARSDPRVQCVMLPVRDGMLLARRLDGDTGPR